MSCVFLSNVITRFRFVWKTSDDAMVGPFSPLLYIPLPVAQHFLGIAAAVGKIPDFPAKARETAILATGSHFKAIYEIYAHERVAEKTTELSQAQINKIKNGEKPDDLDEKSSAAFDVAIALAKGGGPLDDALYEKAKQQFGQVGAQGLIQCVCRHHYIHQLCGLIRIQICWRICLHLYCAQRVRYSCP